MRRNIDDVYRINDQADQKLKAMIALLSDLKQEFVTKNQEINDLHRIPTDLADLSRRMKNVESEFTRMLRNCLSISYFFKSQFVLVS